MICPEKKWRELSSCLITSGYVNAAKLPRAVGTFWNLSILGCGGTFITESLLLSLVSSHKGGAGLEERYAHGMVYACAPQDECLHVQIKTNKRHS